MLERYIQSPLVLHQAQHISDASLQAFLQHLESKGYSFGTIHRYLGAVVHFGLWKNRHGHTPDGSTRDDVYRFLRTHLPHCHCHPSFPRHKNTVRAALMRWVDVTELGRIAHDPLGKKEQWVSVFDAYLTDVAGLSPSTRLYRRRYALEFLRWVEATPSVELNTLTDLHVARYMGQRAAGISLATLAVIACSINSFLRFLSTNDDCSINPNINVPHPKVIYAIPTTQALTAEELNRLLVAIDRTYPVGKRDYAMARCLSDLGLRTSDVAQLSLDDINWRNSVMTVGPGKSRRCRKLPMSDTVRDALVDYLRKARPATTTRAIFVYHRAPLGEAVSPSTIRGAIRRAFTRAGFPAPESQVHRLRHTLATRLLQSGHCLKTIADVLGHQSLETTTRYTHVDQNALLAVALPWPRRTER